MYIHTYVSLTRYKSLSGNVCRKNITLLACLTVIELYVATTEN